MRIGGRETKLGSVSKNMLKKQTYLKKKKFEDKRRKVLQLLGYGHKLQDTRVLPIGVKYGSPVEWDPVP